MFEVDLALNRWDYPTMTLTADDKGRLACRELFPPRTSFDVSRTPEGQILLRKLVPETQRRVRGRLKRVRGRLILEIPGKLAPSAIEDAVREERDSR
jgi:hypothetical protein